MSAVTAPAQATANNQVPPFRLVFMPYKFMGRERAQSAVGSELPHNAPTCIGDTKPALYTRQGSVVFGTSSGMSERHRQTVFQNHDLQHPADPYSKSFNWQISRG